MIQFNKIIHSINKNKKRTFIEKVMIPVGLIGPFMMIPQIIKVYVNKDASSLAFSSWLLFLIVAIMWIWYGFSKKDNILIITNMGWIIADIFMIIGVLLY